MAARPPRHTLVTGVAALRVRRLDVALAEALRDDDLLHFARTVVDAGDADVAPEAIDHVLAADVAVTTEDLHGVVNALPRVLCRDQLVGRRLTDRRVAAIEEPGTAVHQQPRRV